MQFVDKYNLHKTYFLHRIVQKEVIMNDSYQNALRKIEEDSKCRPSGFVLGPTGPTGPGGGETPTLTIGTVTTGAPGSEATATITGSAPDFVLNLTIPQGPTGPTA